MERCRRKPCAVPPADIGSPEAFMDAWMKSPGHAANILKTKYGIIGVGMIDNGDRRVVTTVLEIKGSNQVLKKIISNCLSWPYQKTGK